MTKEEQHPDHLRTPATVCEPDMRNLSFVVFDEKGERPKILDDLHQAVDKLKLNETVPEDIAVQFETSKNIYLYSWFVYRFIPVARLHVLTVLELALRERLDKVIQKKSKYRSRDGKLYLKSMLRYCKEQRILKNEMFEAARHKASMNARNRHFNESMELMSQLELDKMEYDDADIEILEEDWDFDHVEVLTKSLPGLRNAQTHGSTMLDSAAWGTLRTVSEIINQLWH